MQRTCRKCGQTKPVEMFSAKGDGYRWTCKRCTADRWQLKYSTRRDFYLANGPVAAPLRDPATARERYLAGKKNWTRANSEKRAAHKAVERALLRGDLKVQPCERCGDAVGVHAHHDDYGQPLNVMWLCPKHHMERHRELRAAQQKDVA